MEFIRLVISVHHAEYFENFAEVIHLGICVHSSECHGSSAEFIGF